MSNMTSEENMDLGDEHEADENKEGNKPDPAAISKDGWFVNANGVVSTVAEGRNRDGEVAWDSK
jgi:hypothetical protein